MLRATNREAIVVNNQLSRLAVAGLLASCAACNVMPIRSTAPTIDYAALSGSRGCEEANRVRAEAVARQAPSVIANLPGTLSGLAAPSARKGTGLAIAAASIAASEAARKAEGEEPGGCAAEAPSESR